MQIAQSEKKWLGFKLTATGVKPIDSKIQAISDKLKPQNKKDLRSFMGTINQMNRFIPNLAKLCAPLRPLLSKDTKWDWKTEHDRAFDETKKTIQRITEIYYFKKDQPLRIVCDASKEGMGAVLQQKTDEGWKAIHFASRFLTPFEQKYSINELELLAVVWSEENFRNYVYGTNFEMVSDHKALTSILKGNRAKKTFSSGLTRRVDRLIPFQFTVSHEDGRTLGMADYLSGHPSPSNNNIKLKAEELWHNWFTVNEIIVDTPVLVEQNKQPITGELTNQSELARSSDASSDSELNKQCEQTIKSIIASINPSANNAAKMESSDSETYHAASTIEFASKPPLKTPMCYSINQIEILQTFGDYTFAAHFETDEFLQKLITLIEKPDSTKIN